MNYTELGVFIVSNIVAISLLLRWTVNRAIDYTHLQRDVGELKQFKIVSDSRHESVQKDLKGLSMKIDRQTGKSPRPKPED